MDRVSVRRSVPIEAADAVDVFWREDGLSQFWPPIERSEVIADDGLLQELEMAVERDGQTERIRIVRFREPNAIVFFNPEPPPMLHVHRGAWHFRRGEHGRCEVEAEREYRLIREPGESDHDHRVRRVTFARKLRERLGKLLDGFCDFARQGEGAT